MARDLAQHGFSLQMIRRCLPPLRENAARTMRGAESLKYLTDGEELFVITDDRRKILEAMERQFVLSLGIGNLVRKLDRATRRAVMAPRPSGRAHRPGEKSGRSV